MDVLEHRHTHISTGAGEQLLDALCLTSLELTVLQVHVVYDLSNGGERRVVSEVNARENTSNRHRPLSCVSSASNMSMRNSLISETYPLFQGEHKARLG